MKTYAYNSPWGEENVYLEKCSYNNATLAVQMYSDSDGSWEPYAVITVNLDCHTNRRTQSDTRAYLDTNNCPGIAEFLEKNGIAKFAGQFAQSGYCTYPLYEFDLNKF
jgi:hypothetical protein